MKKVIILLILNLMAGGLFAQNKPADNKPQIIYKVDTVQFLVKGYKLPRNSTVIQLLQRLDGVNIDKNCSIVFHAQEVKMLNINSKPVEYLNVTRTIQKIPANIVVSIEIIDDYSNAAMFSFKARGPDKLLNINTKNGKMPDLNAAVGHKPVKELLKEMNGGKMDNEEIFTYKRQPVKILSNGVELLIPHDSTKNCNIIAMDCLDYITRNSKLSSERRATFFEDVINEVDDYGDQIPHFLIKYPASVYVSKSSYRN